MMIRLSTALTILLVFMTSSSDAKKGKPLNAYAGDKVTMDCGIKLSTDWPMHYRFSRTGKSSKEITMLIQQPTGEFIYGHGYENRTSFNNTKYQIVIDEVQVEDSGLYSCSLMSIAPPESGISLTVFPKPIITVEAFEQVENEDESKVVASCTVQNATQGDQLSWVPKGEEGPQVVSINETDGSLTMKLNYTLSGLASEYDRKPVSCVLEHPDFQTASGPDIMTTEEQVNLRIRETTTVPVTTRPRVTPSIEQFSQKVYKQKEGAEFNLLCNGNGYPLPWVQWLFNGVQIGEAREGSSILTRTGLSLSASGDYECVAQSEEGEARSTITLQVQASPKMSSTADTTDLVVRADMDTITLSCQAQANPKAVFTWSIKDEGDKMLPEATNTDNDNFSQTSSITISETAFTAGSISTVVCTAQNNEGVQNYSFQISKEPRPGMSAAIVVIVIVVLVVFVVSLFGAAVVVRRRKMAELAAASDTATVENGCLSTVLCLRNPPQSTADEKLEPEDDETVKEEGDVENEEKQHLTEGVENEAAEQSQEVAEEEKMLEAAPTAAAPKKKLKLGGSLGCCRRSRKKLEEDEDEAAETDNKNGGEAVATAGGESNDVDGSNDDVTQKNAAALESIREEKKADDVINDEDFDRDSGKGDTLKPNTEPATAGNNQEEAASAAAGNNVASGEEVTSSENK